MNPCELVTLVSTLSCVISENFDNDELTLISALLTQLGDSIASIVAARVFCKDSDSDIDFDKSN